MTWVCAETARGEKISPWRQDASTGEDYQADG